MIIALTGTPGTGKSTISRLLGAGYRVIDLNELIRKEGLHIGRDEVRGSLIADLEALKGRLQEMVNDITIPVIIEGHLSHHLKTDAVIVLRTHPSVLEHRLKTRGYTREKIQENMEAEALDVILIEAVERHTRVYEVETTISPPARTCQEIRWIITRLEAGDYGQLEDYLPGRFDWSEEVF